MVSKCESTRVSDVSGAGGEGEGGGGSVRPRSGGDGGGGGARGLSQKCARLVHDPRSIPHRISIRECRAYVVIDDALLLINFTMFFCDEVCVSSVEERGGSERRRE
jgi:hypothetical protein